MESDIQNLVGSTFDVVFEVHSTAAWKETHKSIEDWGLEKFGWKSTYLHNMVKGGQVRSRITTIVKNVPVIESHLREIAKVPEKKQAKITADVMEKCESENRKPTAKDFKKAAKPFLPPKEPKEKPDYKDEESPYNDESVELPPLIQLLKWLRTGVITVEDVRNLLDSIEPDEVTNEPKTDFERFWKVYPPTRKRSPGDARKAFAKAIKICKPAVIIAAAAEFSLSPEGLSSKCPGPAPWLNQERWADDREAWNRGDDENGAKTTQQKKIQNTADAVANWSPPPKQGLIE